MIEIRGPFNVFHLNRAVMYEFILCPKSKNYLEDFEKIIEPRRKLKKLFLSTYKN